MVNSSTNIRKVISIVRIEIETMFSFWLFFNFCFWRLFLYCTPGLFKSIFRFGDTIGDGHLAEILWKLFCNSTAESTKRTYSTATKHFKQFICACKTLSSIRYIPHGLSINGMILCFYTAYLFRLPTITSATTIAN